MRPPYFPNIKEPKQPTEHQPTTASKSTQPTAFRIRYWFVTIYFLFMMPTVLFPAAVLEEFGPIHREITRAGTFYDRGFIFWSVALYCLIGAIAGCLSRPRERVKKPDFPRVPPNRNFFWFVWFPYFPVHRPFAPFVTFC